MTPVDARTAYFERSEVLGFGVGVPGVVDHAGGSAVVHSQTTGWDAVPLGEMLRAGLACTIGGDPSRSSRRVG